MLGFRSPSSKITFSFFELPPRKVGAALKIELRDFSGPTTKNARAPTVQPLAHEARSPSLRTAPDFRGRDSENEKVILEEGELFRVLPAAPSPPNPRRHINPSVTLADTNSSGDAPPQSTSQPRQPSFPLWMTPAQSEAAR